MTTPIVNVPLENIIYNKFQVANTIDQAKVDEIKVSLVQNRENGSKGLLQITRARQLADGRYEQAFGRHRLIAFEQLAATDPFWGEMPLLVSEMTDIEMFELMGIENFHRRDISPIEEASIFNTYMTSFKKSSVEAAQKFGKTEEYVRGSIRLLNLPELAQKMTSDGTITKSGARDLLVALKLGGEKLVMKAIETLQDNGDSFEASECIEQAIREDKEVNWLPSDASWAKEKKFPVKHLAALTLGNITEVIGEGNESDAKEIKRLIDAGMEVTDAFPHLNPEALEKVRVLANPPQCALCPLHAVMDGSHYCGIKMCSSRKQEAWKKHQSETTSKKLGIPLYQKSDGEFKQLNHYDDDDKNFVKKGSPDLRLMPCNYMYNNFEGVGEKLQVVVIGAEAQKRKQEEAKATIAGKVEAVSREVQGRILAAQQDYISSFLWHVAAPEFAVILDGVSNLEYLKSHFDSMDRNADYPLSVVEDNNDDDLLREALKLKKADAMREIRRMIMFHTVYDRTPGGQMQDKKPVVKMAKDCAELAAKWDVKLAKDFTTQAEKYQKELDAALKTIKKGQEEQSDD